MFILGNFYIFLNFLYLCFLMTKKIRIAFILDDLEVSDFVLI